MPSKVCLTVGDVESGCVHADVAVLTARLVVDWDDPASDA